MIVFPDHSVETEYTDPNGVDWIFDGTGWVKQCDCPDGGGVGQVDSFVEFILNGDDAGDGSQDIVDASGRHNISIYSDVYVSTSEKKFGTGSLDFTKGNGYLSVGFSPDLTLNQNINVPYTTSFKGGALCTIEGWLKAMDVTTKQTLIANERDKSTTYKLNRGWYIYISSGRLYWIKSANGYDSWSANTQSNGVQLDQWHHFACTYDGETYRTFLDGVMGTEFQSDIPLMSSNTSTITVGARLGSANPDNYSSIKEPFNGYMDDVMVTMGVCKYTEDFTPPDQIQISNVRSQEKKRSFVHKVDLIEIQEDSNDVDLP